MNRMLFKTLALMLGTSLVVTTSSQSVISSGAIESPAAISQVPLEEMTLERLDSILQEEGRDVQMRNAGQWQLTLNDQAVIVLADETTNRMRIFTPIMAVTNLSVEQVEAMLVANFHTTLDARYAVTDGTVVAVYVHPLASLQADDLRSALQQVPTLAVNFGTTYSSSELGFGPTSGEPGKDRRAIEDALGI